jgi:hypothetical protein
MRPDWWIHRSLIWEFTLADSTPFATSNLDDAALRLFEQLSVSLDEARLIIFRHVPLQSGLVSHVHENDLRIGAHFRHPYLRAQVKKLQALEASFSRFRNNVIGDVLSIATSSVEDGEASFNRLIDSQDADFYLGVNARTMSKWANEFDAYEVQELLRQSRSRRDNDAEELAQSQARAKAKSEHEVILKRYGTEIGRWTWYLDAPDFEPRGEHGHEERALELHRAMRRATTAIEEERLTIERDMYLVRYVFEGEA